MMAHTKQQGGRCASWLSPRRTLWLYLNFWNAGAISVVPGSPVTLLLDSSAARKSPCCLATCAKGEAHKARAPEPQQASGSTRLRRRHHGPLGHHHAEPGRGEAGFGQTRRPPPPRARRRRAARVAAALPTTPRLCARGGSLRRPRTTSPPPRRAFAAPHYLRGGGQRPEARVDLREQRLELLAREARVLLQRRQRAVAGRRRPCAQQRSAARASCATEKRPLRVQKPAPCSSPRSCPPGGQKEAAVASPRPLLHPAQRRMLT